MVSGYPDLGITDGWEFRPVALMPTYGWCRAAQGSDGIRLQALPWSGCGSQRGLNGCRPARKLEGKGTGGEKKLRHALMVGGAVS